MAVLNTFIKQPAEVTDYDIDFDEFFPEGDVISATGGSPALPIDSTVFITSTETVPTLVIGPSYVIDAGLTFKQWLSGGTSGVTYKVTVRVTSTAGRVKEVEFKIKCKDQ